MKVLMISRSTLYSSPGGDTVQIDSTAKSLRELNVIVDIKLTNEIIDYTSYDLLHFFNIIRPADILKHIRLSNKPYVVSTIFVDYSEYEKLYSGLTRKLLFILLGGDRLEYIKSIARMLISKEKVQSLEYYILGHSRSIKKIIKNAKMLLPNSESEYQRLLAKSKIPGPYIVVPNAISTSIFTEKSIENNKYKNAIICVGRIEGRKNQLKLIEAINDTKYNLFIIGHPSPNNLEYYNQCKSLAKDNVHFVQHVTQEELAIIYYSAKVHVLPSWFETTGLVSLEAAVMNCNIVVTKKGDQEEYFKDYVEYCDPVSISSIKNAIDRAYNKNINNKFKEYILENYTWEKAALKTLEAYKIVLD